MRFRSSEAASSVVARLLATIGNVWPRRTLGAPIAFTLGA